jgi:hypothetical protein
MPDSQLGFTAIPDSAFNPAQPGAAFSPGDFYKAYINSLLSMQPGSANTIIGQGDSPVIGSGGQELFDTGVFKPGTDLGSTSGWNQLALTQVEAPTDKFFVEPAGGGTPTALDPSSMLTKNEQQQLSSFMGEESNHGAFGEFTHLAPQFAEIAAFLASGAISGSAAPVIGSIAGSLIGQKEGGATGEEIGGFAGGALGGAGSGALNNLATTDASIAAEAGNAAGGGAGGLEAGGTIGLSPGAGAATGAATGGATAGVNPGGGSSGLPAGGSAPGTSLGTDPTGGSISGGATGGAQTPGAAAIGTGGTDPTAGTASQGSNVAATVFRDFNDLSSAARFAQSLDALTSGTQAGAAPAALPAAPQQAAAPSIGGVPVPSAGATPVSQIAASAIPTGEEQSITQDFVTQTDNAIAAQYANQGISGSAQEQAQLQRVQGMETQRATAAQEAMAAAGITDPNVFAALMGSNLNPAQFAAAVRQTGIT